MIGQSSAFLAAEAAIVKMAAFDAPVLIEGETGTGKELAARAMHYRGPRSAGPFVPVNCGAIPDSLLENELFGHRRGAFTDARVDQRGLVELARHGTLFLDEVDALTPKAQVTLLRFLQDQQFRPLGAARQEQGDVRVIAASNRSLDRQVDQGQFRLDLLYRLKLLHVVLPPLRERTGDAALIAPHFIRTAAARFGKKPLTLDAQTLSWFDRYLWPGNIRELENLVCREFLLAEGDTLTIPPPTVIAAGGSGAAATSYRAAKEAAIEQFEHRFLAQLLGRANGNISAAARMCGTERRHLGRLLKKYCIQKTPPANLDC